MVCAALICSVSIAAGLHAGAVVLQKSSNSAWAGIASAARRRTGPKMDWWVDRGHTGLTVVENNLGGLGPIAGPTQSLRFSNVSLLHSLAEGHPASSTHASYHSDEAIYLDLLVTMVSTYAKSGPVKKNGADGDFGRIAIKKWRSETMKFEFVRHATNEAWVIPEFDFTIFDIDQSGPDAYCCERIQGWKVHNVSMLDNAYSDLINNEDHFEVCSNNIVKTGEVTNPTYIRTLSNAQARASVMFQYRDTSDFYITTTNTCKGPRAFMFAGTTDALTPPNGSWHEHFVPPYVELLPSGFSKDYYWHLGKPADVVSNNLGHRGPIFTDAPEIRYQGVGVLVTTNETNHTVNMTMLDLVIFTEDRYWASDFIIEHWNGQQGEFGEVGLSRQSEVRLIFTFVETMTNQSVVVPSFDFTLFDIDNMADPNLGEEYTVHGASGYAVVDGHYTIVDDSVPGQLHLKSWVTKDLGAIDNPTNLSTLTEDPQ